MKKLIRKWLIPVGIWEYFKNLRKKEQTNTPIRLAENEIYKNKFSDVKRCFILATGPSIKDENLELLQNEFCISVSNFFVHEKYSLLKPEFHVFAPLHTPITPDQYLGWINDALINTNFKTTYVICESNRDIVETTLSAHNTLYYLHGGNFPVDFTDKLPPVQTVVHVAIYLAMYLGIKEIYLLGTDHSWILHYGESKHFYEESKHVLVRQNYSEWTEEDIGKEFENNAILWSIYRKIRTYSHTVNTRIVNLSKGSLLDVFERNRLENIF